MMTTDGASNMMKSFDGIESKDINQHLAHAINLAVKDGLNRLGLNLIKTSFDRLQADLIPTSHLAVCYLITIGCIS